jgi:hypothetical protein
MSWSAIAIVFGAWVEYRSLSIARRIYLDNILVAAVEIQRTIQLESCFHKWKVKTQNCALLRDILLSLYDDTISPSSTPASLTTSTTYNILSTTPYHLKNLYFGVWQSWLADQRLVRHALRVSTHRIMFQAFVSWSQWTIDERTQHSRHYAALATALRKRMRRAFSQWRLGVRLSVVHRQHCGNSSSSSSTGWSSLEELLSESQRSATQLIIPRLRCMHMRLCWSMWTQRVLQYTSPLYAALVTARLTKRNALKEMPTVLRRRQWARHRRLRRIIFAWKLMSKACQEVARAFCLRTIGRRALDRWLFVHVQRQNTKIIASPKVGYGGRNLFKHRPRTLRLPNRSLRHQQVDLLKETDHLMLPTFNVDLNDQENIFPSRGQPSSSSSQPSSSQPSSSQPSSSQPPLQPPLQPLLQPLSQPPLQPPSISTGKYHSKHLDRPLWDREFDRLSVNITHKMNSCTHVAGDIALHFLFRIGAFRSGWLRSLGGAYTLMRKVVGNEHDFGFESIHMRRDQFNNMLSVMLRQFCGMSDDDDEKSDTLHKMISSFNRKLQADKHTKRKKTCILLSESAIFCSLSKMVRDKYERMLWSVFRQYGHRGSHGVMLVASESMLRLAEERNMINAGDRGRRATGRQEGANCAPLFHTGITRRTLCKIMTDLLSETNGLCEFSGSVLSSCTINVNGRPKKRIGTTSSKTMDGSLTFPDFCVLVSHLSLIAPDFSTIGYEERLEQMLRTMRIHA